MIIFNILYYYSFILMVMFLPLKINAQELIRYDSIHSKAAVHYNQFLEGIFSKRFEERPLFPIVGDYSPTGYALQGVKTGVGCCNYIYIPTNNQLIPGHQYHLSITIKIAEAYRYQPYYQNNFGIALTSDLFDNYFGLWPKHSIPLGIQATNKLVTIDFEFRPLCSSKYMLLGVFQGVSMDDKLCFACPYAFELHSLQVKKTSNPNNEFYYICDGFIEDKLKDKWESSYSTDTIYFDSGSAALKKQYRPILDSIPNKLRSKQDLVSIYAFTDKKGSDNNQLGADRNTTIKEALIKRGVDSLRILTTNYGETKSTLLDSKSDRKVEIDVNLGKLHQKYYCEALELVKEGNYGLAQKKMMKYWLKMVPPNIAIYAIFDCWGEGVKSDRFKKNLYKKIKAKFYAGEKLKFTLDSLYCEDIDNRQLRGQLTLVQLPTYKNTCQYKTSIDLLKATRHQEYVNRMFTNFSFPSSERVGKWRSGIMPKIIIQSNELNYLQKYLPLVKSACEKQIISWEYYARLYDKIMAITEGFQKYGTMMDYNYTGVTLPLFPIEDILMLKEYRKQVKLVPFPDHEMTFLEKYHAKIDKPLVQRLNSIHQSDQQYRNQTRSLEKKYGRDSDKHKVHWKLMRTADSINLIEIKKILDQKGWLSPNVIGKHGSETLFLVIQHADLLTQLKYLPLLRNAVKKGDAQPSDLAMLEDRVSISQGEKQIYGTQLGRDNETGKRYVSPLIDPDNVNKRRKKVGLEKIEDYIKHWGMDWKIEKQNLMINKKETN